MKKKEVTIHKSNQIIRGGDKLSLIAKRALNVIYYSVQRNVNEGKTNIIQNLDYLPIQFPFLRQMLGLNRVESYITEIEKALKELQTTTLTLNNFTNPKDGQFYNWYSMSFLSDVSWMVDKQTGIKKAYVALPPLIKHLMINTNNGNFTSIDLIPTINKLRTRYSVKLFEFFQSFKKFRYIDLPQDYLIKILGLEEKKDYKYYSHLFRLLERQIKEIAKKTDLIYLKLLEPPKDFKKAKLYRFIINPNSKKDLSNRKKIEEMTKNLFQRF